MHVFSKINVKALMLFKYNSWSHCSYNPLKEPIQKIIMISFSRYKKVVYNFFLVKFISGA